MVMDRNPFPHQREVIGTIDPFMPGEAGCAEASPGEAKLPEARREEDDHDPLARELAGLITLEAEVPEALFQGMRSFIDAHPHWDQYSVIRSALAGFLFQNGCQEAVVTQHYLDGLFLRP